MTEVKWRDILGRDVDWIALNGGKWRSTNGLRKLFSKNPKWTGRSYDPNEMEYGAWYEYTLGDIANIGRREWVRQVNVGEKSADLIELAIDMAAEGRKVIRGPVGIGSSAYVPKCERGDA